MSIIQCDEDCLYQHEGYCALEMPSAITSYTGDGCVHCIHVVPKGRAAAVKAAFSEQAPQTPL